MESPLGCANATSVPWERGSPARIVRPVNNRRVLMTTSSILAGLAVLATIVAVTVSTPATAQTHAQTHAVVA